MVVAPPYLVARIHVQAPSIAVKHAAVLHVVLLRGAGYGDANCSHCLSRCILKLLGAGKGSGYPLEAIVVTNTAYRSCGIREGAVDNRAAVALRDERENQWWASS